MEDSLKLTLYFDNAIYVSSREIPDNIQISFNLDVAFTSVEYATLKKETKLLRVIP